MTTSLLAAHTPLYFVDAAEKVKMINLNRYIAEGVQVEDNTVTGVVSTGPDGRTLLSYFAFYPRDDGLSVLGGLRTLDAHKYDLERVTVELDAQGTVMGVCYFPHGHTEHYWIRGSSDLQKLLVQGRPHVYCSRGKHGSYPVNGTIWRYFGFANDHCEPALLLPNVTVVPASEQALALPRIDGVFPGLPPNMRSNLSVLPTVALSSACYHLLCTLPPSITQRQKQQAAAMLIVLVLTATLIAIELRKKK